MSALSRYEDALQNYPHRGSGLHQHLLGTANLGCFADVPPSAMVSDMNRCFEGIRYNEADSAVSKAIREFNPDEAWKPVKKIVVKPKHTLDDFIKGQPTDTIDLWEASPVSLVDRPENDGRLLINTLYSDTDWLFVGDVFDTKVRQVSELKKLDLTKFPHIIPNPMTGKEGLTDQAKISYRCENTVADARFAVCEMDEVPINKQVGFWMKCIEIKIPVAAIIHSGNKSLHGWVRVSCGDDVEKWNELVRDWWFREFGAKYGLDTACQNRARLSRLPGHQRSRGMQKLFYLNGDAS